MKAWIWRFLALLAVALSALALLAMFGTARAETRACMDGSEVIATLTSSMPGIYVYDEVGGADFAALAKATDLPQGYARLLAFKHPLALGADGGPVLLLVFFDGAGCAISHLEAAETRFNELVAAARAGGGA